MHLSIVPIYNAIHTNGLVQFIQKMHICVPTVLCMLTISINNNNNNNK